MSRLAKTFWTIAAATMFVASVSTGSQAQQGTGPGGQIGVLTCVTIKGTARNLLIHSTVGMDCTFETTAGSEKYRGESGIALGLDLNWNREETLRYGVIAGPANYTIGSHALAGKYVGGKASVTAGAGLGAAALIGGGEKGINLQPLAIETSKGLGLAGGAAYLFLAAPK